jgi:hypothetical protein
VDAGLDAAWLEGLAQRVPADALRPVVRSIYRNHLLAVEVAVDGLKERACDLPPFFVGRVCPCAPQVLEPGRGLVEVHLRGQGLERGQVRLDLGALGAELLLGDVAAQEVLLGALQVGVQAGAPLGDLCGRIVVGANLGEHHSLPCVRKPQLLHERAQVAVHGGCGNAAALGRGAPARCANILISRATVLKRHWRVR